MYKEFHGQVYPDAGLTGQEVLDTYEIEDVNPTNDMIVLIGYAAVIHFFSFAVLWGKHIYQRRNNGTTTAEGGKNKNK